MNTYNEKGIVNIGTGEDTSIKELAQLVKDVTAYQGSMTFDSTKPDGTPRKLLDVSKIHGLGWHHKTPLKEGLKIAYQDFLTKQQLPSLA
jgi:GDP-L-fucose synthase